MLNLKKLRKKEEVKRGSEFKASLDNISKSYFKQININMTRVNKNRV